MSEAPRSTIELSIVIPAWNEEKRIIKTLKSIDEYLSERKYLAEVLVVDDGSTDSMVDKIAEIQPEMPYVQVLSYGENRGKGYATRYGMLKARGRMVLFMDSDGSTSIGHFDEFQAKFDEGYDVVISNRYMKGSHIAEKQPLLRRVLSRIANKLIQVVLLWGISDTQNGFKAFTHDACQDIFEKATIDRWGFDMEVLAIARRNGFKIAEVPIVWNNDGDTRLKLASDTRQTLHDLFYIKTNIIKGKYDAKPKENEQA